MGQPASGNHGISRRRYGYVKVRPETPHLIFKEFVNPTVGLQPFSLRKLAFKLGLTGELLNPTTKIIAALTAH